MPAARYKKLLGTQMPMAPRCQNPHHPMASPPFSSQPVPFLDEPGAAGMVPGSMVGGLPPDIWVTIFQGYPKTLELLMPWPQQELQEIYGARWWQVVAAEALIMSSLCFLGLDKEALVQELQSSLRDHTAIFLHWQESTSSCTSAAKGSRGSWAKRTPEPPGDRRTVPQMSPDPSPQRGLLPSAWAPLAGD